MFSLLTDNEKSGGRKLTLDSSMAFADRKAFSSSAGAGFVLC